MRPAIVAARNISKSFGGVQALREVSVALHRGEIRGLVGENGSGKSTLIQILAGVLGPDAGEIVVDGKTHAHLDPREAIRAGIQVIYQDFSLFPNLTVAENLALNTELEHGTRFVSRRRRRRIATAALARLGRDIDLTQTVAELSVADKQLVAIARALLHNARVIIMDEPTTALTQREVQTLFGIVADLKAQGMSLLFVGHKLQEVLALCDAITVLRNGRNVAEGEAAQFSPGDLVRHMTGRHLQGRPRATTVSEDEDLLKVTDLSKAGAFAHVSFAAGAGEVVGITGLLGSGRTELALSLFGLAPADSGTIEIAEQAVRIRSVPDALRAGIAYVPEDRLTEGVFAEQSIERNLAISGLSAWAHPAGWISPARLRRVVAPWLGRLRIQTPSARMPVAGLSGGNQQKVVLGRWLATQARVLILNGPTVGVDVGAKADIHAQIRELVGHGLTALLISDDLRELAEVCDRILVMHRGRIVREIPAAGCDENALARELGRLE
ncbi:MAG: sugar ABC transporter ATP-binding protein [Planctomycetes bacterium]|nr:sugar ABC transporter ATP-binding protein [Planctomycetota bacterium]